METTQGNSLCRYLYLMFLLLSLMLFLLKNWRTGVWNRFCGGVRLGQVEGGRWCGKGEKDKYGANNVYTCM
jgi:hypothetical protein